MSRALGKSFQQIEDGQSSFNFLECARSTDPEPSHAAAEKITDTGARLSHCERIMAAVHYLAKHGQKGVTGKEIAACAKIEFVPVMRRLNDLRNSGELVPCEKGAERICRIDGKAKLTTWWLTG
jgi:hypothetical protein